MTLSLLTVLAIIAGEKQMPEWLGKKLQGNVSGGKFRPRWKNDIIAEFKQCVRT